MVLVEEEALALVASVVGGWSRGRGKTTGLLRVERGRGRGGRHFLNTAQVREAILREPFRAPK